MSISVALQIVAVIVFAIATLLGFGVVSGGPAIIDLVALGLVFHAAAHLPV
jgi:hypothetical protein